MSLKARRDALLKSSISIKSIRDSIQKFNKGLESAKKNAAEIVKNTKESNLFKKSLISKDNNFFRIRRENIRRKQREDEIEAASLQGPAKQRGSILAKSTRGFLGRLLDFVGILLIGWAITNLPKIIAALSGVIKLIRRVAGILGAFINTISNIIVGIGQVISDALSKIPAFDFQKNKKGIEENINRAGGGLAKLDQQLVQTSNEYTDFGDEMEQLEKEYEEKNDENNENNNTNNQQSNQNEEEGIQAQQQKISFGVDKLGTDIKKAESSEDEQIDPTKNIKAPPKTEEMPEMEIVPPKDEINKVIDKNLDTSEVDTKKILDEKSSSRIEGTKTDTPEVASDSSRVSAPKLTDTKNQLINIKKNVSEEVAKVTGDYDADFESGEGGKRKVNLSSLLTPTKKDVNVKSKKKKGNTVFIVEKPIQTSGSTMMASAGSSGKKLNFQKEVQLEQTLMKLQSVSTLKYT
jgi:hypothetical protein|tara:strand:+ start:602 stop:1993 length:1392 start_codon:yes stop_codon:yes gene_type:complete